MLGTKVIDFLDSPEEMDLSVQSVPGSDGAFLQIVANLNSICKLIQIKDGVQTRQFGLYKGTVGNETLFAIFGLTPESMVPCDLIPGTRICIRGLSPGAQTTGILGMNFIGDIYS